MQEVTAGWLFERGGLHDARVRGVRQNGLVVEIDLDDEWANERGLGLPEGSAAPGTLIISTTDSVQRVLGGLEGGWISEVEWDRNDLRLTFCDRDVLVLSANSVTWRS